MKGKMLLSYLVAFLLIFLSFALSKSVESQKARVSPREKALCSKMIRFGKEALMRKRYEEAREYFRKAIQADPDSEKAWRLYDQAVISSLAYKLEMGFMPHSSPNEPARKSSPGSAPSTTTSTAVPSVSTAQPPTPEPGFVIEEDEGC